MGRKKKKEQGPPTLKEALAGPDSEAIRIMALHRFIELGGGRWAPKAYPHGAPPADDDPHMTTEQILETGGTVPIPRNLNVEQSEVGGVTFEERRRGRTPDAVEHAWSRRLLIDAACAVCRQYELAVPSSVDCAALNHVLASMVAKEDRRPAKKVIKIDGEEGHEIDVEDVLWTVDHAKQNQAIGLLRRYAGCDTHLRLRRAERAFYTGGGIERRGEETKPPPKDPVKPEELAKRIELLRQARDPERHAVWSADARAFMSEVLKEHKGACEALGIWRAVFDDHASEDEDSEEDVDDEAGELAKRRRLLSEHLRAPVQLIERDDETNAMRDAFSALIDIMDAPGRINTTKKNAWEPHGNLVRAFKNEIDAMLKGKVVRKRARVIAAPHPLRGIGYWGVAFLRGLVRLDE
jgi:hypothetical protein